MIEVSPIRSAVIILKCIITADESELTDSEGQWLSRVPMHPIFGDIPIESKLDEYKMALMAVPHPDFDRKHIMTIYAGKVLAEHRSTIFDLAVEAATIREAPPSEMRGTLRSPKIGQAIEALRDQWGLSDGEVSRAAIERAWHFKSEYLRRRRRQHRRVMLIALGAIVTVGIMLWFFLWR